MKTSHLKKGLLWTGITTLVLFVVLVVHLILVLKPKVYDNNHMQLVKVDFPENIDTTERSLMLSKVKSMQGVKKRLTFIQIKMHWSPCMTIPFKTMKK